MPAVLAPFSILGHFVRRVVVSFHTLSFRQVVALARSLAELTAAASCEHHQEGDIVGCCWNTELLAHSRSAVLYGKETSQQAAEQLEQDADAIDAAAPGTRATEYLRYAAAVVRQDLGEAIDRAHAFVDRDCYGASGTSDVGRVLLPFGDLMVANALLRAGNKALSRKYLEEAFEVALEWYSEQCMAESSWMLALAAPQSFSLAQRDLLWRAAYDQAARLPAGGGAFQRLNCSLALAVLHASISPSMVLSPILQCNQEPSPITRALSHITTARASAMELFGKTRAIAEERI
jgi:hypothetical protein